MNTACIMSGSVYGIYSVAFNIDQSKARNSSNNSSRGARIFHFPAFFFTPYLTLALSPTLRAYLSLSLFLVPIP